MESPQFLESAFFTPGVSMNTLSIPVERKNKLKELARLMNKQNEMPTPAIRPILELLDYDVTDGEIDFLLNLGTQARTREAIAALSGMDEKECNALLDRLIRKGFLWPGTESENHEELQLTPFVVGWLEFQLLGGQDTPKSHEFARRLENLFQALQKLNVFPMRGLSNALARRVLKPYQTIGTIPRDPNKGKGAVIPINKRVEYGPSTVLPVHDAYELVDRHGANNQVAVVHCFCRRWRHIMDDPCRLDLPLESCVVVGPAAEHISDYGFGRKIEKNGALKFLEEMAAAGAIHTLFHEKDDTRLPNVAVCNCCWDCCGIYGSYNRGIIPLYFQSHYRAHINDPDACKACNKCVTHCPVNAISLEHEKSVIQEEKCIGCGQCALQCPTNAIGLELETRDVLVPLIKKSETRLS
jgi:ferredoxin